MFSLRRALSAMFEPFTAFLENRWRGKSFRVLTYHRVNSHRPTDRLSVSPEKFAAQLDWLVENGFSIISLSEAVGLMEKNSWPNKCVCITFDDGYADNFLQALPELKKRNVPAAIFVTSAWIDGKEPIPICRKKDGCPDPDERDRSVGSEELLAEVIGGLVKIGSHTCTHRKLSHLGIDEIKPELEVSKAKLEKITGREVSLLAYPSGDYDGRVLRAAKEAGYVAAVTVGAGRNTSASDKLQLTRTEISGFDDMDDFRRKLCGAFDPLHKLAAALRKLRIIK